MVEILKKNWFECTDRSPSLRFCDLPLSGTPPKTNWGGKSVDGKDVVASIDGLI